MGEGATSLGRYIHLVPKRAVDHMEWRRGVLQLGYGSRSAARDLWVACSRDMLFWINTFCYTFNPQKVLENQYPIMPFNTWEFQDHALLEIQAAIGRHDLLIEKSRDMGATWMCLATLAWHWQFREYHSFLIASRNADLVDKAQDPDTLFWKLDFLFENQPSWLNPKGERRKFHVLHPGTQSTIDGAATTADFGRAGRRTALMLDEFAFFETKAGYEATQASQHNTNCRLINSTPSGPGCCYDDLASKGEIKKIRLFWTEHPEKALGLYTSEKGALRVIDHSYTFPVDYQFRLDGKIRSPWYDLQCDRASHPQQIAREVDIDSANSEFRYFEAEMFKGLRATGVIQAPWRRGELDFDAQSIEPLDFHFGDKGRFLLWFHLGPSGKPPTNEKYAIGVDVAEGTGASNAVVEVWNRNSGEQVCEFASPYTGPDELANIAVATGRWFNNAQIKWEAEGPGRSFGKRVLALHYGNIFYREREHAVHSTITNIPGWWPTKDAKRNLLFAFRKGMKDHFCVPRSEEMLKDAEGYIHGTAGIEHVMSRNSQDPTGARESHGDRALASALAWSECESSTENIQGGKPAQAPQGSFAWRRERWKEDQKKVSAVSW